MGWQVLDLYRISSSSIEPFCEFDFRSPYGIHRLPFSPSIQATKATVERWQK